MKYIVACALGPPADPGDLGDPNVVHVTGLSDVPAEWAPPWEGELGLCTPWATGAAPPECELLVSACVLARTNARGLRVPISLRGQPVELFGLRNEVKAEEYYRDYKKDMNGEDTAEIERIESFAECTSPPVGGASDVARNCCWAADRVGRCVAGTQVKVVDLGETGLIRICGGIHGCDHDAGTNCGHTGTLSCERARYVRYLANSSSCSCPSGMVDCPPCATFTCPANGPMLPSPDGKGCIHYGYFSVMIASKDSTEIPKFDPPTEPPKVLAEPLMGSGGTGSSGAGTGGLGSGGAIMGTGGSGGTGLDPGSMGSGGTNSGGADGTGTSMTCSTVEYPASEYDVFTYREGAFYGNVFKPYTKPAKDADGGLIAGAVYQKYLYACYSNEWALDDVYLTGRLCAGTSDCFQQIPTRCHPDGACGLNDGENGAYLSCPLLPAAPADFPITVFLNDPDDLGKQ